MTQPQPDPARDVGAALARLAEQTTGLQRQVSRLEAVIAEHARVFGEMQNETESRITALTEAKLTTYRTLIDSQTEKVALALSSAEKAVTKAETATEKRFDSVNEFRQQLNDQAASFMPRTEAMQLSGQATERLRELAGLVPTLATRAEMQAMADRQAERIGELQDRINRAEGQGQGAKDNRAGLFAVIAAVGMLISIVVVVANLLTT